MVKRKKVAKNIDVYKLIRTYNQNAKSTPSPNSSYKTLLHIFSCINTDITLDVYFKKK